MRWVLLLCLVACGNGTKAKAKHDDARAQQTAAESVETASAKVWLTGPQGNSAHYLTWPDGSPRAQLLPERDAAWAAGNREYILRSINVEHEKLRLSDPWTDEEYRNLARLSARIVRRTPPSVSVSSPTTRGSRRRASTSGARSSTTTSCAYGTDARPAST